MHLTTPYFNLFTAPLYEAVKRGLTKNIQQRLKELKIQLDINDDTLPVGLRWNMHKEFGFPRSPFKVYRRPGTYNNPITILDDIKQEINGEQHFNFLQGEMYIIAVNISLETGQRCLLQPTDRNQKIIPHQVKEVTTTDQVIIKCPFMNGLQIRGNGTLLAIKGVLQQEVVNATDWQLIQEVGLPFEPGMVGGLGYTGDPQGYAGTFTNAPEACLQRLTIGGWLHLPMPEIGDAAIPVPPWNAPDPNAYLNYLFHAQDSLLKMIHECLTVSNDFSYSPAQRQPAFSITQQIKGIHQSGGSTTNDAKVKIPVVGTTLLAATTDSYAALALGFGTTDFTFKQQSSDDNKIAVRPRLGVDYMVTASYTIRPFEMFQLPFLDELSKKIEFAALGCELPLPNAPETLTALSIQKNRPTQLDGVVTESVKLRWNQPPLPQGYGSIVSYKSGQSRVLNIMHTFQPDTYQTLNTFVPKDVTLSENLTVDAGDAGKFVITEPDEPLPDYGTEPHSYLAAGLDVFGRWSSFSRFDYTAAAIEKQNAGIIKLSLKNNLENPPASIPTVSCTLEVEFSWQWADRSPATIELAAQFYPPITGSEPPAQLTPVRFAKNSSNPEDPVIIISFDAAGNPIASQGVISNVPVPAGTPAELKKYRLVINDLEAVFPGASPWVVGYAVYVRALEKVRVPALDYSNWSNAYTTQLEDPRKPATVFIPATLNFTALPDAAKKARGVLTWPAAAGASTYHVWEANETAIRTSIDQPLKTLFPADATKHLKPITASLQERANQLRDIFTNAGGLYTSVIPLADKYFNRLTKDPLGTTRLELELPGSSKVLHIFRISSVNSANIESDKSGIVFFAVPQIVKPLPPKIELRKIKEQVSGGVINYFVDVKVIHGDYNPQENAEAALAKVKATGFKLYKTRKQIMLKEVGAKGLPYKLPTAPDWQDCDVQMLNGDVYKGKKIRETVLPSWKPFCYQAVAMGKADPAYGEVSGESDGSVTETIYLYLDTKPLLLFADEIGNPWSRRLAFTTDAPFFTVEGKAGRLEVHKLDATTGQLTKIKEWKLSHIAENDFDHNLPPQLGMIVLLPVTNHRPVDASGITRFSVVVPRVDVAGAYKGVIRIFDPLGRFSDYQF